MNTQTLSRRLSMVACAAFAACSSPGEPSWPDDSGFVDGASVDSGRTFDSGETSDGGQAAQDAGFTTDAGLPELRLLFVGNSYTFVNDLPHMLESIAAASQLFTVVTESVVVGGATLAQHWSAGTALGRLRSGSFTHVVLQDQSLLPAEDPIQFDVSARRWEAAAVDAGVVPTFYVTWALYGVDYP